MNGDRLVELLGSDLEGLAVFVTGPLDHRQTDVQHAFAEPGCPQEHDRWFSTSCDVFKNPIQHP
ncbi:MAG TPA: hypothetical protein D7I01_01685 [Candidatus Poseidoniales archaeon]|nr:MAG TPA: hypothetical protein D7I01_01685 [Candidatus Poseidoniales archaeon]